MNRRKTDPPRGVLKTAVSDRQRYCHKRYHAAEDLGLYVEHFWVVEWDLRGESPEQTETLPHPSVHMVFESNGRSRIIGPARQKCSTLLEGKGGVFSVKFTPAGFYPFVGVAVSRFADKTLRFCEVFGTHGDELDRAVLAQDADLSRIDVVESFLRSRLPEMDENVSRVSKIVYEVAKERGIVRVQDLVDRHGLNKRMLQRLFERYVGVSPKWVIQRYRLHEVAERLAEGEVVDGTRMAFDLGYFDQAHFIKDFKAIVGKTPAEYAKIASVQSM